MYPTLLRDELFPTSRRSTRGEIPPAELDDLVDSMGVIARVKIDTSEGEYPLRTGGRIEYPIGRFVTTLAGPDLRALREHGKVVRVYSAVLYSLGRPFREAMEVLLEEREKCKRAYDNDGEMFAKLCANSLAGKLAQHQGKWKRLEKLDAAGVWGDRHSINAQTEKVTRYRYVCGACWEWCPDESGAGPHTSAFCYLTAYGRQRMRTVRLLAGKYTVVSQDTDGLWVTRTGLDNLIAAGQLAGEGPGSLRIKDTARTWTFLSPRHYCTDGKWTLAGLRDAIVASDGAAVEYSTSVPLFDQRPYGPPSETIETRIATRLAIDRTPGIIGEDGWIRPRQILKKWGDRD